MVEIPIEINGHAYKCDHQLYRVCPYDHTKLVSQYSLAPESLIRYTFSTLSKLKDSKWARPDNFGNRSKIFRHVLDMIELDSQTQTDHLVALVIGQGRTIRDAIEDRLLETCYLLRKVLEIVESLSQHKHLTPLTDLIVINTSFVSATLSSLYPFISCLLGNVVVWIPDERSIFSDYLFFKLLRDNGVPAGMLNFIPSNLDSLTGALANFSSVSILNSYPHRASNFPSVQNISFSSLPIGPSIHILHMSANIELSVRSIVQSSLSYSGQHHSHSLVSFVPQCLWKEFAGLVVAAIKILKFADPTEEDVFSSAVVDKSVYNSHLQRLYNARASSTQKVHFSTEPSAKIGYFAYSAFVQLLSTEWFVQTYMDKEKMKLKNSTGTPIIYAYVYEDVDFQLVVDKVRESLFESGGYHFGDVSILNLYCSSTGECAISKRTINSFKDEFSDDNLANKPYIAINEYELPNTKFKDKYINEIIETLSN